MHKHTPPSPLTLPSPLPPLLSKSNRLTPSTVSAGTSIWQTHTEQAEKAALASSAEDAIAGVSCMLDPGVTTIWFSPPPSIVIAATPVDAFSCWRTSLVRCSQGYKCQYCASLRRGERESGAEGEGREAHDVSMCEA